MSTDTERQTRLARIEKLLALAAGGTTEAERQSAYAKAADMMTRHGVTDAQLAAGRGEAPESVQVFPFAVPGTAGQGKARASAAATIARALGCRALLNTADAPRPCMAVIVGMASDVQTLRMLLPLVLTQAEHAAGQAAAQVDGRSRRGFVSRFLIGYGQAVAERIAARRTDLRDEARSAGTGADVVLADREERVRAVYDAKFPAHLVTKTRTVGGSEAGRHAGQRAHLGDGGVTRGNRGALSSR